MDTDETRDVTDAAQPTWQTSEKSSLEGHSVSFHLTSKRRRLTVVVGSKLVEYHDDNVAQFLLSFTITALLGSRQEENKGGKGFNSAASSLPCRIALLMDGGATMVLFALLF